MIGLIFLLDAKQSAIILGSIMLCSVISGFYAIYQIIIVYFEYAEKYSIDKFVDAYNKESMK